MVPSLKIIDELKRDLSVKYTNTFLHSQINKKILKYSALLQVYSTFFVPSQSQKYHVLSVKSNKGYRDVFNEKWKFFAVVIILGIVPFVITPLKWLFVLFSL